MIKLRLPYFELKMTKHPEVNGVINNFFSGVPTQHCFVTSCYTGVRRQVIDIGKYKMKDGVMQLLKPTICYSQW